MNEGTSKRRRWARGQKYRLTDRGREIAQALDAANERARAAGGRAAFDDERAKWASLYGLDAEDGAVISEVAQGKHTIEALLEGLSDIGATRDSLRKSLERLFATNAVTDEAPADGP